MLHSHDGFLGFIIDTFDQEVARVKLLTFLYERHQFLPIAGMDVAGFGVVHIENFTDGNDLSD